MNKIIWIPAKNLWWLWYKAYIYISIYKTLKINWYKCYFLQPNKLIKLYLLKSWINKKDILEIYNINNFSNSYKNTERKEYRELVLFIKKYFWNFNFNRLLNKSIEEYNEYDFLIKKYNIDTILVYNGIYKVWKLAWLDNNCEIVYFENGYFPNTIQIDNYWINAESSITKIKYIDLLKKEKTNNKKIIKIINQEDNINLSFIKRWFLSILSYDIGTNIIFILYFIKKWLSSLFKDIILKFENEITLKENWKYIFIAFQVHDDTQLIFNSKIIEKMDDILDFYYKDLNEILPEYKIVVKEHPMDIWRINYKYLQKKYPDIIWIKKWNIDDIIEKSEYVICTNSSVWLQALSKYKKVFTLWDNFYSNNPWVEKLKDKNSFREQLIKLKNKKLDKEKIDEYINIFKNELFINWSWKWWAWENFNKKTIKEICEYIVK